MWVVSCVLFPSDGTFHSRASIFLHTCMHAYIHTRHSTAAIEWGQTKKAEQTNRKKQKAIEERDVHPHQQQKTNHLQKVIPPNTGKDIKKIKFVNVCRMIRESLWGAQWHSDVALTALRRMSATKQKKAGSETLRCCFLFVVPDVCVPRRVTRASVAAKHNGCVYSYELGRKATSSGSFRECILWVYF